MGQPRAWQMGEVVVAARALLAVEREAARGRRAARWICESDISIPATEAVARRFGRGRTWLEALLEADDAARADPDRFGAVRGFLDRGGAPLLARRWVRENRDRPAGEASPLPPHGACAPLVVGLWPLTAVAVAARALLTVANARAAGLDAAPAAINPAAADRKSLTVIARLWGEQADWLRKILELCAAAEADPESFGRLVGIMDKAGRPQAAWKRMTSLRDERRVRGLRPLLLRCTTLVIDPPWDEDNLSTAAGHAYAQMAFDEICALPIDEWAEDDCHLYLWATNNTLPLATKLIEIWGFAYKTCHTWVKETADLRPKIGLGRESRNSTEHVLFARRGSRDVLPRADASYATATHHRWPVGENSEKPEGFYDLVRGCSYPRYGEAFARKTRPDFTELFVPAEPAILVAAE